MKALKNIFHILTLVLLLSTLVLFFFEFATVSTNNTSATLTGAQLGFGLTVDVAGETYDMARSADIFFCLSLTMLSILTAAISFTKKFKGSKYVSLVSSAVSGIYMLVIALSNPIGYIDTRPLSNVGKVSYTPIVLIVAGVSLAAVVSQIVYILIADLIEVKNSKKEKLPIPKRIIRFLREYKSEIKKIVWPGPRAIVKNTFIVLIICILVGAFIWILDLGIIKLLEVFSNLVSGV